MLLQESAETAAVVLFLLSPFYTGQSVLPENSLQAVGPDIRSLRCSFSPKGFYRWGVRGLINHLSAQFAYSKFTGKTSHFNLQPVVAVSFTRFLYLFFFFPHSHLSLRSLQHCQPVLPGCEVWHRERDKGRLTHLQKQGAAHYFSTLEWTTAGISWVPNNKWILSG